MTASGLNFKELVSFAHGLYGVGSVPLHRPVFEGNEISYLTDCVNSNFVSSVGVYVDRFEDQLKNITGVSHVIAMANGTAALHMALLATNVQVDDEVITQSVTFVATCNAIRYAGAWPVFVDVDEDTMSLSPQSLRQFLEQNASRENGQVVNRSSGRVIRAVIPMHTFGFPGRASEIRAICDEWGLILIDDAAEALGSYDEHGHVGIQAHVATLSFNGNKVVTTGGGGAIFTNSDDIAALARHLSTTAKVTGEGYFDHDMVGYNFRLPALNAALGVAQLERLETMLDQKREIEAAWDRFLSDCGYETVKPRSGTRTNNWLTTFLVKDRSERDSLLDYANHHGVMLRPMWRLMSSLPMFEDCQTDGLKVSKWLEDRVVNLPSSVRMSQS